MDPITLGSLAVGGIGALKGLFKHDPVYNSPHFADVNLERENPELWQELQNLNAVVAQMQSAYDARKSGLNSMERGQLNEGRSNLDARLSNQGLLGTSAGMALESDLNNRAFTAANDRSDSQANALLAQLLSARHGYLGAFGSAQNALLNNKQDEAKTRYGAGQAEDQAQNQFFSGLFNAGLGLYGQSQNPMNPANRAPTSYTGVPSASSMAPLPSLTYSPGPLMAPPGAYRGGY